jgi:hypothetical protein
MATARGTFDVQPGGEDRYEALDDGAALSHAWGDQRFSGDIEGDGSIHWLMAYGADRTARYVGQQRIRGTIDGRTGVVVIAAGGMFDGERSTGQWSIVPGMATGELAGIAGSGTFTAGPGPQGTYELEYTVPLEGTAESD